MKSFLLGMITLLVIPSASTAGESVAFGDSFIDSTLRVDYYHTGNATEEFIAIDRLYRQGVWAGNPRHLVDPIGIGRYRVSVFDLLSNTLIYSKGYDSYFGEYKMTKPAKEGVRRTYHESVLLPYPRKLIRIVFEVRERMNLYHPVLTQDFDPADYHVITETPQRGDLIVGELKNGSPHDKVDIAVIAEGYTLADRGKFSDDLHRYTEILFGMEPYNTLRGRFNIYGVFTPSPESGVDEPRQGSYRNTALGASFNSLDSDRYLLVEDNKTLRDIAAQVPYDIMIVMVNSKRYGGGAFYGSYATFTTDDGWSDFVFHHEFGHAFGGLADEYYTSDVPTDEFFPPGVEPVEPNITALLDPKNLKWKELVSPGLSIPTPWGQETFDSLTATQEAMGKEHQSKMQRLRRSGALAREMANEDSLYNVSTRALTRRIKQFMEEHPLRGKVGAFEGAGFAARGLYRPTVNSIMHQFNKPDRSFYAVNESAIRRVIKYYSE